MTHKLIGLLLVLPLVGAEPAGYKYWSAAELKSMAKPLPNKADAKTSNENLANFGADRALMVHREGSGVAGTMPGSKTTTAGEVRGPSIEGGERQKIAPGDILHIPPKTPHQVLLDPGAQITYFTLKVKE